ncbi:MAG: GNAT family N-acetyltransferase [Onishia taeanensis]|uniref:GNAT family N-acetyltransferase n=1 Tax=Onishia taeanensis TaxID=284577 RepID=UPI003C79B152
MNDLTLTTCQGQSITPYLEALARLRHHALRDYPYLYDGDPGREADYLARYAECPQSLFVLAFDGETLVGAATGMPLAADIDTLRAPFAQAQYRVEHIFFFGESLLMPDYRGRGIGTAFMEAGEDHAFRQGFAIAVFRAVEREHDHPLTPADYRPLNDFWHKRGYQRMPNLATSCAWKDVNEAEPTHKPMACWLKQLTS